MTTTRDFEAELFAAFTADRTPGATLAQRATASDLVERILTDADDDDLYARAYDIDEQARQALYR